MEGAGDILRRPLVWGGVLLAGLLGVIMTFSYLGGFLDPVRHLEGLDVAVVNADRPVEVAGNEVDAGPQVVENLLAQDRREVDFVVYPSRAAALSAIRDNDVIGAIVIPKTFSAEIGAVGLASGTGDTPTPATLELVSNEGAGLFQAQVFDRVISEVDDEVNAEVSNQLVGVLEDAGLKVDPAGASTVGRPVEIDVLDAITVAGRTGRGLAPFYTAIMATLTGFLAASITSLMVDVIRGRDQLELFGEELHMRTEDERPLDTWIAKAVLGVSGACLGGFALTFTAVQILGMHTNSFWATAGVAMLGASTFALVTLIFLTLFGIGGELLGVLFTTIFGVPAALGIYPVEALPPFFRFVSSWHPMHYLTDGVRAQVFYEGRAAAGMRSSVAVLAIWFLGALVIGFVSAWWIDRRGHQIGAATTSKAPAPAP